MRPADSLRWRSCGRLRWCRPKRWAWALISMCGLAWIYVVSKTEWSNYFSYSGDRVIDSAVVGAAALTPLLAAEALRIKRS